MGGGGGGGAGCEAAAAGGVGAGNTDVVLLFMAGRASRGRERDGSTAAMAPGLAVKAHVKQRARKGASGWVCGGGCVAVGSRHEQSRHKGKEQAVGRKAGTRGVGSSSNGRHEGSSSRSSRSKQQEQAASKHRRNTTRQRRIKVRQSEAPAGRAPASRYARLGKDGPSRAGGIQLSQQPTSTLPMYIPSTFVVLLPTVVVHTA